MALTVACLLLAGFMVPHGPGPAIRCQSCHTAVVYMEEDGSGNEGELDMSRLRQRIEKIQNEGLSTPAQKLFDIATERTPGEVMRDFFSTASPQITEAMQDAVLSLLGSLPPLQFDSQVVTTGDRLAALMLQLQMTGYMLRNAEYVFTLRRLLDIKSRSEQEYRAAFDQLDSDGSGFIEYDEVQTLLEDVYDGDPPPYEVSTFMQFFDTNNDGKISWEEFSAALGASATGSSAATLLAALPAVEEKSEAPSPKVSGKVTVTLEDGNEVEMDADVYMEELKREAQNLRAELASIGKEEAKAELALSSSISAYVSSLPEQQLKLLTQGITEDVVGAMRMLVDYILQGGAPSGDRAAVPKEDQVRMEQQKLQQLCLYQLVLGYRLREAEATGEAQQRLGL